MSGNQTVDDYARAIGGTIETRWPTKDSGTPNMVDVIIRRADGTGAAMGTGRTVELATLHLSRVIEDNARRRAKA